MGRATFRGLARSSWPGGGFFGLIRLRFGGSHGQCAGGAGRRLRHSLPLGHRGWCDHFNRWWWCRLAAAATAARCRRLRIGRGRGLCQFGGRFCGRGLLLKIAAHRPLRRRIDRFAQGVVGIVAPMRFVDGCVVVRVILRTGLKRWRQIARVG